jgi:hypothetical protein
MVKKFIITGLFSVISTASFASNLVPLKQDNSTYVNRGTAYVGASAGFPVSHGNEYSGDVFAGYGKKFGQSQRIYLGGELSAGIDHYTRQYYSREATTYSLGASFIPGLMLTPTLMAYGRVGVKGYRYENSTYASTVLGVGLQKDINKKWGVRGELTTTSNPMTHQASLGVMYKLD